MFLAIESIDRHRCPHWAEAKWPERPYDSCRLQASQLLYRSGPQAAKFCRRSSLCQLWRGVHGKNLADALLKVSSRRCLRIPHVWEIQPWLSHELLHCSRRRLWIEGLVAKVGGCKVLVLPSLWIVIIGKLPSQPRRWWCIDFDITGKNMEASFWYRVGECG